MPYKLKDVKVRRLASLLGKRETNRILADIAVAERLAKTAQQSAGTPEPDWQLLEKLRVLK